MPRVLLIDDDVELISMLSRYLEYEDFDVCVAHDGDVGSSEAVSERYDIVVLDIMMPRLSGIEVLRRIREKSGVPVLMLTARGDNVDKIVGLNMGADDYVPKPCTPAELVARIRAILRRTQAREATDATNVSRTLQSGGLALWPGSRRATWGGQALDLTGTEFSLLEVLVRHAGKLVRKQDISQQAFGRKLDRFDRRIDVHISAIRQKLGVRADGQPWIQNVRGLGYQLMAD
jgi:DNA-binding response OmpR family regulator